MALADFEPERVSIEHKGRDIVKVRGLCLDDVSILVRGHLPALNALYEASQKSEIATVGAERFVLDFVTTAPDVAFDIIALSADEPEYSLTARKLPMGLQIKILQEVLRLTLEDVGGPLALMAMINRLVKKPPQELLLDQPSIQ